MRRALGCAALLVILTAGGAQAQSAAGTWTADFVRGIRRTDSVEEVIKGQATLVIAEVRGDSVFGTWTVTDGNGTGRALKGTLKQNVLKAVLAPAKATINTNGEIREVTTTVTLEATITGDNLKGTMLTEGLPDRMAAPREWTATRKK